MNPRATLWGIVALLSFVLLPVPAGAGLVSYYPMNLEATGPIGTSGTFSGTVVSSADRHGVAGQALSFAATSDTAGSHVSIPGGGGLNNASSGSISLWVRYDQNPQDAGVIGFYGAVLGRQSNNVFSNNVLGLSGADPSTAAFRWHGSNAQGNGTTSPGVGNWHHVAVTFTPGSHRLYVDGSLQATIANSTALSNNTGIPLTIGAWTGDGNCYSNSTIDDVAVFDTVLTPAEVAALANSAAGPLGAEIRPVGGRASSELTGGHNRRVGNLSDGLGRNTTDPNGWAGNVAGMWLSASGDPAGYVNFDLGSVHAVDWMAVHNYNEVNFTSRGVQTADVRVSTDGANWTSLGVKTFTQAPASSANPGQLVAMGGVQARYVQMDILTNFGDASYTGLNEVDFYGTALGPKPIPHVTATASSSLYTGGFDRRPLHTVDATGLYAGTHFGEPDGTMWLSNGLNFSGSTDGNPEIVFDLQKRYERLEGVRVWNYNENNFLYRGIRDMQVLGSADGVAYTLLGTYSLAKSPGGAGIDYSQFLYLGASGVRYVKFDILSNWNGVTYPTTTGTAGNDYAMVGLAEAQFTGEAVPEPATMGLALLGLAGLRRYARRRGR